MTESTSTLRRSRPWRWAPLALLALAGCGWATGALVVALTANRGGGGSDPPPPDTTPPSFAGATSAVAVSPWSIELRWSPATDNVTPQAQIVYAVYHSTTSGAQNFSAPPLFVSDPGVQVFMAGGLTPNTTHYFVVRARDAAGNQDANTVQVSATTPAAPMGAWQTVASMGTTRAAASAALLSDGRLLIAGGQSGTSEAASAELYDPATNSWTSASAMSTGRSYAAAAVLHGGRVLVAGGSSSGTAIAACDLFDPATGSWTATGALAQSRSYASIAMLRDGRVIVMGGLSGSTYLSGCEIYDESTGAWTAAGGLGTGRVRFGSVLLSDGRVLVAGGSDSATTVTGTAEIYDPATGTWASTGSLATATMAHSLARLRDGRILAIGGQFPNNSKTTRCELFDPATAAWTSTGGLAAARAGHCAVLLPSGQVLAAGGWQSPSVMNATCETYDSLSGQWASAATLIVGTAQPAAIVVLPDGRPLIVGGVNGSNATLARAEVLNVAAATATWRSAGALAAGRGEHTATLLPDGRALITGGFATNAETSTVEIFDPVTGAWTGAAAMASVRSRHTATLLPGGQVLVAGGRQNGPSLGQTNAGSESHLTACELYLPGSNTWTGTGALATGRAFHVAHLLPDGRVFVAGGYNGSGDLASLEVYDPATGTWIAAGALTTARRDAAAATLLDGRFLVAGGVPNTNTAEVYATTTGAWSSANSFTGARGMLSATTLADGRVLVAGGWDTTTNFNTSALWSPTTGTWSAAATLASGRGGHAAARVLGSRVLVAGGQTGPSWAAIGSCELYDPAVNTWTAIAALTTARAFATLTPLTDESVLIVGGGHSGLPASSSPVTAAERWNDGRGFADSWRPRIEAVTGASTFPATLSYGSAITLSGAGFYPEVDIGNDGSVTTDASLPLVELEGPIGTAPRYGLADAQRRFVLPATNWASGTSLTVTTPTQYHPTANPTGLGPGHYYLRVTVNGVPSVARIVRFVAFGTGSTVATNPSVGIDWINALATDGTSLYVVGADSAPGNRQWRIEKRSLSTGALDQVFGGASGVVTFDPTGGDDEPYSMVLDPTHMYLAGFDASGGQQWRIEKRSLATGLPDGTFGGGTGVVTSDPSSGADVALTIVSDGTSLYVAGWDRVNTNAQWRIEKRDMTTGQLVTGFGASGVVVRNPSATADDAAHEAAIDATSLYVVGIDRVAGNAGGRIEKYSLSNGALVTGFGAGGTVTSNPSPNSDYPCAVAIAGGALLVHGRDDSAGTGGQLRIEKYGASSGALDANFGASGVVVSNPSSGSDVPGIGRTIVSNGTHLWCTFRDVSSGSSAWRVEKRQLSDGALDTTFGTAGTLVLNFSAGGDEPECLLLAGPTLYVAGWDTVGGNEGWRIEAVPK